MGATIRICDCITGGIGPTIDNADATAISSIAKALARYVADKRGCDCRNKRAEAPQDTAVSAIAPASIQFIAYGQTACTAARFVRRCSATPSSSGAAVRIKPNAGNARDNFGAVA